MINNKSVTYHVITNFTELSGAESALIKLVNSSQNNPFKIISLMEKNSHMVGRIIHPNCEVIELGAYNAFTMLVVAFNLAEMIKKESPGEIYAWMYHANAVSSIASLLSFNKAPLVWGVRHSLDDYQGEKMSTKIAIQIGKLLKFVPDNVIYCSQRAQKQHEEFGYNAPEKSIYIPNGYEFPPIIERCFSRTSLTFGAAGRFHDAKDYKTLIKAIVPILAKNPEATLKMCGRNITEDNAELTEMIEQAGINSTQVILMGLQEDMTAFYNQIDVFILSSKTEGFPNVLAEAAAHGCAVFSTDVGDASVIVNNPNHIVPIADSTALTQAIDNYLSLPSEQRKAIAFATTQHVRSQFSISHIAEQFFALGR
ncbi:TPA: glycosyltransferase [Vibrio vulnificus]|nr:glycosyltransferase [Vibrio vulnificus]